MKALRLIAAALLLCGQAMAAGVSPAPLPMGVPPAAFTGPGFTNVGMEGIGASFLSGVTWWRSVYCGFVPGTQTGTAPVFKFQNFTGAASLGGGPETGYQPGGPFTLSAGVVYGGHYYDVPMQNGLSQVMQPGDEITSRPVSGLTMTPGSKYCYVTLVVPPSASSYFPVSRNTTPSLGEEVDYGAPTYFTTPPGSPMGATLTTSAATANNGTTLTFASTDVSQFFAASLQPGNQVQAPCLAPNTVIVGPPTATQVTISPGSVGGCASGQTVNFLATRGTGASGPSGFPAADILWSTPQPTPSVLIVGDSKAVGLVMQSSAATSAPAAAGQNVLTFKSTAVSTGFLYPGEDVPWFSTNGVPHNAVIGAITPTTVTLVDRGTGAPANLVAPIATGATINFGLEKDPHGHGGSIEKGFDLCCAVVNQAVSGDALHNLVEGYNSSFRSQTYAHGFKYAVDEYGVNDLSQGFYPTYAAFIASKRKLWAQLAAHGIRVVATTINVETNSSYGLIPAVLPTIAAGGSGYAPNSTFDVTLAGGTLATTPGNPATPTRVSVSTNASGVVSKVNAVSSIGYYGGAASVPASPNAPTGGTGTGVSLNLGAFFGWLDCASQSPLNVNFAPGGLEVQYNDALRSGTAGFPLYDVLDISGAGGQQPANDAQCWAPIPASFNTGIPGVSAAGFPATPEGVHDTGWGQDLQAALIKARVAAGIYN